MFVSLSSVAEDDDGATNVVEGKNGNLARVQMLLAASSLPGALWRCSFLGVVSTTHAVPLLP